MNPFVVQNFCSNKGYQFRNKPPMTYPQLVQNGYFSSVSRNNMLRYPYHAISYYSVLPQNPKPLPANHLQFGPGSRLLYPVASYGGLNQINQNSPYPRSVLNGRVRALAEHPHQTQLVIAKNEPTRKMHPSLTQTKSLGKNFTKSPLGSDTNHARLLDVFNKNFNLSRPTMPDVHDQKRKQIAPDEEVMTVQNSCSLLNGQGNKRMKPTLGAQNDTNRCVNNQNVMKKNEDQTRSRFVIQEDENGWLRVCSEPLSESNNLREESISKTHLGGNNTKASLVDKDNELTDLDLTLHL